MSVIPNGGKPSLLELMTNAVTIHQSLGTRPPADAIPDAIPMAKEQRVTMLNNNKAPAPELVLLKRYTPPKEEPMSNFSDMLKAAVTALDRNDLDRAETYLDMLAKQDIDDDEDDEDDDDQTDEQMRRNFQSPSDPTNDADDEDDDDDDEFDKRYIRKASDLHSVMGGAKPLPTAPKDTPMSTGHKADPYSLGNSPAVRSARAHKFDSLVSHVMERDSCSKNEAMATARREYGDVYRDYQDFVAGSPTNEQATRRAGRGVGKAMPMDYESLVAAEIRKGNPWRVAEQKVVNLHGSSALSNRMIKRDGPSVASEFSKRATQIMWQDGTDRTEAMRRLRKEQPWLYDALNAS
jgi:hypothetical protein